MSGPMMRARHSLAFLAMMDVTETIAGSVDDYVAVAARLAHDAQWRAEIGRKIADNRHRLYRDRTPIAALEDFLERAVRGTS